MSPIERKQRLIDEETTGLARALLDKCREAGVRLAFAESCTGGLLSAALTDIAGSSAVVERGFVTYSNEAKTELLGVPSALIKKFGAVSEEVAQAMAEGVLKHSPAQLAVAITGIAGPSGGSSEKPVGLVHFAVARDDGPVRSEHRIFPGDRRAIRGASVAFALQLLDEAL